MAKTINIGLLTISAWILVWLFVFSISLVAALLEQAYAANVSMDVVVIRSFGYAVQYAAYTLNYPLYINFLGAKPSSDWPVIFIERLQIISLFATWIAILFSFIGLLGLRGKHRI